MGWSFRKSVKMGPIRLNLSKSGVGISAGIKGARISAGPRGTYITLSAGGFQYRKKLDDAPLAPAAGPRIPHEPDRASGQVPVDSLPGFISTASVADLSQSSAEDSLQDIQQRVHRFNWFALYVVAAGALILWAIAASPPSAVVWGLLVGLALLGIPVHAWSEEQRTARLLYDVDDPAAMERFALAAAAGESLASTKASWHVYSSVATTDWKRNAGASALIRRTSVQCINKPLPHIESNILPWSIPAGPQQLMFLPDRLLVYENGRFAGVPYDRLSVQVDSTRFIEDAAVPSDAKQVGTTWRYVNKSGGPDRRFNDNRQLLIMQYAELSFRSSSGMNIVFHVSNHPAASNAAGALNALIELATSGGGQPLKTTAAVQPAPSQPVSAPALPSSSPPHSPMPASGPDAPMEQAMAFVTVLKYIGLADRRFTEEEKATIEASVRTLFAGAAGGSSSVGMLIQQIRPTPQLVEDSLQLLCSCDLGVRQAIYDSAASVALADGKITPKERERLQEVATALGIDPR